MAGRTVTLAVLRSASGRIGHIGPDAVGEVWINFSHSDWSNTAYDEKKIDVMLPSREQDLDLFKPNY